MACCKPSADIEADFMATLLRNMDGIPGCSTIASTSESVPTPKNVSSKSSFRNDNPNTDVPISDASPLTPTHKPVCVANSRSKSGGFPTSSSVDSLYEMKSDILDVQRALKDAEDWDWDMNGYILSPPKKQPDKVKPLIQNVATGIPATTSSAAIPEEVRCTIVDVSIEYSPRFEKRLTVSVEVTKDRRTVVLQEGWVETEVHIGDMINVIGSFEREPITGPTMTINNKQNLLILHPDLLLTATAISTASQCLRRPLLSALLHSTSDITPSLVWGNMLHDVMQSCLRAQKWTDSFINERVDEVVLRGLSDLVRIGVSLDEAKTEIKKKAGGMRAFSQRFIGPNPKPNSKLSDSRNSKDSESLLAITGLHDVEEDIWSPSYGLRGKIDATIQSMILERNGCKTSQSPWTMPLEIKTGRAIAGMEHRAQTILYTLLIAQRYGVPVPSGLLYYTQSEDVIRVPASWNEVRGLIMTRNEMAGYMMQRIKSSTPPHANDRLKLDNALGAQETRPFLPPTIDNERICARCYVVDACMLYRKAVDCVVDDVSPIEKLYNSKTSHLTPSQLSFFAEWENLITSEEQEMVRLKKELWTMGAAERERKGRCLSDMILDTSYTPADKPRPTSREAKIHRHTYQFIRRSGSHGNRGASLSGHIMIGEPVLVSVEPHLLALARGFVLELRPDSIVLGVDQVLTEESLMRLSPKLSENGHIVFRIDKDELTGGMARVRDNLAQLFYAHGDVRRLELVVDLKTPRFNESDCLTEPALPDSLNVSQRHAIVKAINAHDYALILGMPGTGKTTTIAELIDVLVQMGKTVLLTSYTHSAVDTILRKLKDKTSYGMLRIGNIDKIHPDIHEFTLNNQDTAQTTEEFATQLLTPSIVATTCLSIDHAIFSRRTFDYCIMDEASQITLPTCVGPLRLADKFILVGDHFQLPPLVRNRKAREGGLDVSLFRRLSDAHPQAVVDLVYQYRMNEDIMLLSNRLIYGDRLKCGSRAVAEQTLQFTNMVSGPCHHSDNGCWLRSLMSECCRAVFVNTDKVPARESRVGELLQNNVEAALVHQIATAFLHAGISQDQIGIVSFYRQQVKLLAESLDAYKGIEVLTADRSQGRDKDCIIISLVRSNETGEIGELLKDWRRINVAFTRARAKLIIIGSKETLKQTPLLSDFFSLMEEKRWILTLPKDAPHLHSIVHATTAVNRSRKRCAAEDVASTENRSITSPARKPKRAKAEDGLLRNRPVLRDVMNDVVR